MYWKPTAVRVLRPSTAGNAWRALASGLNKTLLLKSPPHLAFGRLIFDAYLPGTLAASHAPTRNPNQCFHNGRDAMKKTLPALAGLTWLILTAVAHARIEADPNKDYAVTPEAGPWMISATCYVGPEAPNLAHELVVDIRNRFDFPAWVCNQG